MNIRTSLAMLAEYTLKSFEHGNNFIKTPETKTSKRRSEKVPCTKGKRHKSLKIRSNRRK